jgi:hypothetical protein
MSDEDDSDDERMMLAEVKKEDSPSKRARLERRSKTPKKYTEEEDEDDFEDAQDGDVDEPTVATTGVAVQQAGKGVGNIALDEEDVENGASASASASSTTAGSLLPSPTPCRISRTLIRLPEGQVPWPDFWWLTGE